MLLMNFRKESLLSLLVNLDKAIHHVKFLCMSNSSLMQGSLSALHAMLECTLLPQAHQGPFIRDWNGKELSKGDNEIPTTSNQIL